MTFSFFFDFLRIHQILTSFQTLWIYLISRCQLGKLKTNRERGDLLEIQKNLYTFHCNFNLKPSPCPSLKRSTKSPIRHYLHERCDGWSWAVRVIQESSWRRCQESNPYFPDQEGGGKDSSSRYGKPLLSKTSPNWNQTDGCPPSCRPPCPILQRHGIRCGQCGREGFADGG